MVPFGKVFARKPEDWFSGSLLSSFAVSRFGKKRKTPEKPWNILSGPSWATLPDHSSAQNYQLRKELSCLVPLSNPITVEHEAHIVILIASYSEVIGWTQ